MEQKNKHEISLEIKKHVQEINELLPECKFLKLDVKFHSESYYVTTDHPLHVSITETVKY